MKIVHAVSVLEGEHVYEKRVMPVVGVPHFDPFVRVEHFQILHGGFPTQSHHGFEAIFYLFSGELHHDDDLGNSVDIHCDECQLYVAGHGISHSEMVGNAAHGIRVWIDLPEKLKGMEPTYQKLTCKEMPVTQFDGIKIRTIVGEGSPLQLHSDCEILDISMASKSDYKLNVPKNMKGFVYVIVGSVKIQNHPVEASETMFFEEAGKYSILSLKGARLFVALGEPHEEPIKIESYIVE